MQQIFLKILVEILGKLVTPEMTKQAEVYLIAHLKELAKSTDNELDDEVVAILAKALGVPY